MIRTHSVGSQGCVYWMGSTVVKIHMICDVEPMSWCLSWHSQESNGKFIWYIGINYTYHIILHLVLITWPSANQIRWI